MQAPTARKNLSSAGRTCFRLGKAGMMTPGDSSIIPKTEQEHLSEEEAEQRFLTAIMTALNFPPKPQRA
jgi:hypothetical protein